MLCSFRAGISTDIAIHLPAVLGFADGYPITAAAVGFKFYICFRADTAHAALDVIRCSIGTPTVREYKAAGFKLICGPTIYTGRRAVVAIMPVPQTISVLIFCQMCLCPRTPLADDLVAPDDLRRLSTCRILPLFICETGLQIDGSQVGAECEYYPALRQG